MKKGILLYKGIEFEFVLDRKQLELKFKPNSEEAFKKNFYSSLENGIYSTNDVYFKDGYLIGKNEDNFSIIVMIIYHQQFMHNFMNDKLYLTVDSVFELYKNANINRISVYSKELDYIYNIEQAIGKRAIAEDGTVNLTIKPIQETESREIKFQLDAIEITVNINITTKVYGGTQRNPIELKSKISACFEATKDYIFILKVYKLIKNFLEYLCFRKNINIEQINVFTKNEKNLFEKLGELKLLDEQLEEESTKIMEKRYIPFYLIEDNVEIILQELADDSLYTRHIPESHNKGMHENEATFIILVAAFEWEFNQLYTEGLEHSTDTIEAQEKVRENICEIIKSTKGKEKKIYKNLLNFIGLEGLAERINYTCRKLNGIIGQFGKDLYELNGEKLDYTEMGKRIAEQRNHFAHGDLDKEFIGNSLIDLIFLKEVVYVMQLKRLGVTDDKIKKCINMLFYGRR